MRNTILGSLVGLMVGIFGALAFDHFLGEGTELKQAQTALESANANLASTKRSNEKFKNDGDALSAQVQQLTASNDELKHQVDELKKASSDADDAAAQPNPMADMVKAQIGERNKQKMLLLKARLHLTPEQEAALKTAMDAEDKRTEEMTNKMFRGGKFDPTAVMKDAMKNAANMIAYKSPDQTLEEMLTPDQKTAYQQMKDEEKKSNVETMATFEMNQLAPTLGLTEAQKDQVFSVLCQNQMDMQDPESIKKMSATDPSNPGAFLEAREKAKEDALAKVLTPDQLSIYHQQMQSQLQMQKTMMQKFMPAGAATTPPTPAPTQ